MHAHTHNTHKSALLHSLSSRIASCCRLQVASCLLSCVLDAHFELDDAFAVYVYNL